MNIPIPTVHVAPNIMNITPEQYNAIIDRLADHALANDVLKQANKDLEGEIEYLRTTLVSVTDRLENIEETIDSELS